MVRESPRGDWARDKLQRDIRLGYRCTIPCESDNAFVETLNDQIDNNHQDITVNSFSLRLDTSFGFFRGCQNTTMPEAELPIGEIFETASDGVLITDLESGRVLAANPAAASMHGYAREEFIGLGRDAFVHAESLVMFNEYAQEVRSGGVFEALAPHVRRDGSRFHVEWRAVSFSYQKRNCALAVIRDVSKRVHAERQLQQRVEVRAHEQSTLLEISQTLASTLELQPGLILDKLGMLIQYTRAGIFTLEASSLVALAMRGMDRLEDSQPFCIRLKGEETLAALFNGHHPIRIADVSSDERPAVFLRTLLEDDSAALLEGVQSWMWVPLAVKNRIIGGIGIAHTERNYFTPHHASLAMTIANQAAVTLVNAELYEHARELAALQERQRLAQNLHDAVNQSLFSAGLIAEVLPRLWERNPEEARRSLEDLRRLTRGAMAEMRALLAELRPTTLTDSELGDLLRLLGNAFTGRTNVPVEVTVSGEGGLPAETQVALYRICQEALNNIAKHAKAGHVDIDVRHADGDLELRICDDGCGFDPNETKLSGHYGLGMMRERAEAVGARLTVTSQLGQGTEVKIRWSRQEDI
jgi:PAS domain S-box-containing protein